MSHPLHLFRRDLRLIDNTSLNAALADGTAHIGFIFDPRQVTEKNRYKSPKALRFLCDSLRELCDETKKRGGTFNIWYDKPAQVIRTLCADKKISALHVNTDYTPFSMQRDAELEKICDEHRIPFTAHHDALLIEPGTVKTGSGQPFKVFTPFYKAALNIDIPAPKDSLNGTLDASLLPGAHKDILAEVRKQYEVEPASTVTAGRAAGLKILSSLADFKQYKAKRDIPSIDGTTHLSTHNKFGTVSIREVHARMNSTLGDAAGPLTRQLYWRDFFTHVAVFFPHVFGNAFNEQFQNIAWENDREKFNRWCEGTTGFPIVDAGMRELNETGYMHNRTRMITASFLVKDLHIDWRWGEQYFARRLVDYDPCVNNGSWQWAASTGCDAQPYFRIFNPWLQQKRFDPDCIYIKKWIPELSKLNADRIHKIADTPLPSSDYPAPMVDHKQASTRAKEMFASQK